MPKRGCRPLAARQSKGQLFPTCYVIRNDEPEPEIKKPKKNKTNRKKVEKEDPVKQWTDEKTKANKEYIKSWYYPYDAFNPWPAKTDLACWWCTCKFDWTPFPLPHKYSTMHRQYEVMGVFCGPSCAKAYAMQCGNFSNIQNICQWINIIAMKYYGYKIGSSDGEPLKSNIAPAPRKELLQKYCGKNGLTIEQFRSLCRCGRTIEILPPGWVTSKQVLQAEQTYAQTHKTVYHMDDPDHMQRTTDLVRKHRIPFAGLRGRRLCDFYKSIN